MPPDEKDFPRIYKKFGEFVDVYAGQTTRHALELAKKLGFEKYEGAKVSCGAFNVGDFALVESIAAALLDAVAFARAVNRERGLE